MRGRTLTSSAKGTQVTSSRRIVIRWQIFHTYARLLNDIVIVNSFRSGYSFNVWLNSSAIIFNRIFHNDYSPRWLKGKKLKGIFRKHSENLLRLLILHKSQNFLSISFFPTLSYSFRFRRSCCGCNIEVKGLPNKIWVRSDYAPFTAIHQLLSIYQHLPAFVCLKYTNKSTPRIPCVVHILWHQTVHVTFGDLGPNLDFRGGNEKDYFFRWRERLHNAQQRYLPLQKENLHFDFLRCEEWKCSTE